MTTENDTVRFTISLPVGIHDLLKKRADARFRSIAKEASAILAEVLGFEPAPAPRSAGRRSTPRRALA